MASYHPPKKNTGFIMYAALVSQADTKLMQSNPTIAAGDFKVSIDGGALTNLTTLPAVTPASSKMVKFTLSAAEMNGDNITIVCSDVAGAEWCDTVINLQTVTNTNDELYTLMNTVAGYCDTEIAAIKAKTDQLVFTVANKIDANTQQIAGDATAASNLKSASLGLVLGAAITGTLSQTQVTTDLTAAATDYYKDRLLTWITGSMAGQQTYISAYNGTTKMLTVASMTGNPSNGDTFVIS